MFSRCRTIALLLLLIPATLAGSSPDQDDRTVTAVVSETPPPLAPELEALRYADAYPGDQGGWPAPVEELLSAETLPDPGWRETQPVDPDRPATPEQPVVTIDGATGEVYEQDYPDLDELLRPYTEAGIGLRDLLDAPEEVARDLDKMFPDWTPVPDPTGFDYPCVVKLKAWIRATDGILYGPYGCSGTLIDPMHVITAAHCIWKAEDEDNGRVFYRYVESVLVIPSYESGEAPFGWAGHTQMHVWGNWSSDQDRDHDVGVIDLNRPLGAMTGWTGYGYSEDCDTFEDEDWEHAGYPGDPPANGEIMYRHYGSFDSCALALHNRIGWDNYSAKGTSGAGTVRMSSGAVYAVHSSGDADHSTDCVLTEFKFNDIAQMISDDKPGALDLHALDVASQDTVEAGERPDHLDFAVLNYSHGTGSGDWNFNVYLSDDSNVNSADTWLGSYAFNRTFNNNSVARVDMLAPLIPADTPGGEYYLGILLTDVDANIANNPTNGQDAWPITITCPPSIPPTQLGPNDGRECSSTDVYFSWTPVATLAGYQLEIDYTGGVTETIETQQTWHIRYGLQYGTTYWWRVRSMAQCAEWGDWSPHWLVTTEPDPDVDIQPVTPADGQHCVDPATIIRWEPFFNTMGYEFRIGTECGGGSTFPTENASIGIGMSAGMEYFWQVRAQTHCGEWTPWSSCSSYKTTPNGVDVPSLLSPADALSCTNADPYLVWYDNSDVASWDVEFGTSCGGGTSYNVTNFQLPLSGLQDGVTYYWRVRANHECGLTSAWSPCWSFGVDAVAPSVPANFMSSHTVETWSADNTIYVDWEASSDNCALPLYSCVFDQAPLTIPDDVPDAEATNTLSPPLPDGTDHWFHIKAIDSAGNISETAHLGPFWIDAAVPSAPQIEFTTVDPNAPCGVGLLTVDWSASIDPAKSVAGYSWWLDIDPAPLGQPDLVVETTERTLTLELEYEGNLWFFLRAVDAAGNGSDIVTLGPYVIDNELLGVAFQAPVRTDVLTEGDVFPVAWWYYDDGDAVLQMGRLEYSLDGGQTYTLIGNLTPAQVEAGAIDWTVPVIGSEEAVLRISVWDTDNQVVRARSERFVIEQVSGVEVVPEVMADRAMLGEIRPNPFNPMTRIGYEVPRGMHVQLRVYDSRGRLVRTLVDEWRDGPGGYEVRWDGVDDRGRGVVSGVYLCRMLAGGRVEMKGVTLVR